MDYIVESADVNEFDLQCLKDIAATCPAYQARVTARAITRYYNACFKPFALTAEQFSLLVGIGISEGATVVDLALSAGVDATTLSRNIQNLELRKLLQAEGGRGRAGKRLSLTHSGRDLMAHTLPIWESAKAELSRQMGNDQLVATTEAMTQLAKAAVLAKNSTAVQQ